MPNHIVKVGPVIFSNDAPLSFIAGPCVIESEALLRKVGRALANGLPNKRSGFVLKSSFDKANRTSVKAFRGPGLEEGLRCLAKVAAELGVPCVTDVHEPAQAEMAARYVDMLQVPAFLCRQTDLLLACGRTGKAVNVKKGQFLAPGDMRFAVEKILSTGNKRILLTERGTSFGYGNLIVDPRSYDIMRSFGFPILHDATHCVQLPGGMGSSTGGQRQFVRPIARAAAAIGVAGIFFETHPNPDKALSDGPNSLALADAPSFMKEVSRFDALCKDAALAPKGPRS